MRSTAAPKLSALSGPAGHLGEPRRADDLPQWAVEVRDMLDGFDHRHFDGSAGPWIWQADSHELVAMYEEGVDLPRELWRAIVKSRR